MIPSSSFSSFPQPAAPSSSSSSAGSSSESRASIEAAKGNKRDFDDLIDRNNRGSGHSDKQQDKQPDRQTVKHTDKPIEDTSETKDSSSDPSHAAADKVDQTAQTAAQLAAQQAAEQAARQALQQPAWPMFRLNLASATANPTSGAETGAATVSPLPSDLQPKTASGPMPLLAGKAGPQAPGGIDPSGVPGTPAPGTKDAATLQQPSALQPSALPVGAQAPAVEQAGQATPATVGQAALAEQLLKTGRESKAARQATASSVQKTPVDPQPGEATITASQAVNLKGMPVTGPKEDQANKGAIDALPAENGLRIPKSKEAGQESGGAFAINSQQSSVSGEISKTTSVTPRSPDISSTISGTPAIAGAGGAAGASAGARVSETGAAGRIDAAPILGKVWEAAEAMSSSQPGRVDLDIPMRDNENVKIRVELRAGEIHATIRTDSPELREALQKSWPDFAVQTSERGLRLAEANFSPGQQEGNSGQYGQGSNRDQQLEQQSEGQQNSGQGRSGGGLSANAGNQSQSGLPKGAPAIKAPAPAGPVTLWA